MDLEKIKVLNEHLNTLERLASQNVAVYREINRVNAAIQREIEGYTPLGVSANLHYHAENSDVATWDEINNHLLVTATLTPVSEVLQYLRYHSISETEKHFNITEVQVSNILCLAARICDNAVY